MFWAIAGHQVRPLDRQQPREREKLDLVRTRSSFQEARMV